MRFMRFLGTCNGSPSRHWSALTRHDLAAAFADAGRKVSMTGCKNAGAARMKRALSFGVVYFLRRFGEDFAA
jgi:hypothetical protein